jgi:hypothetical protein
MLLQLMFGYVQKKYARIRACRISEYVSLSALVGACGRLVFSNRILLNLPLPMVLLTYLLAHLIGNVLSPDYSRIIAENVPVYRAALDEKDMSVAFNVAEEYSCTLLR